MKKTSAENFEKKEKKVAPKKEKKIRPDGEAPQPFMAMFVAMWQEFNWSKQNQANPAEAVSIEDFRKIFRPTPTDMSNLRKIIVSVRALCEAKKIVWTQEYARKSWKKFLEKAWEQDRWLREHWLLKNLNQNKDLILQNKTHDTGKSINGNNSPHGEKLVVIVTIVRLYSVGFEYHTFPDDHGVTIVTGVSDIKTPRYFEDTYEWFDKNRSEVLHL